MKKINDFASPRGLKQYTTYSRLWEYPWVWERLAPLKEKKLKILDVGSEMSPFPWFLADQGFRVTVSDVARQYWLDWQKASRMLRHPVRKAILDTQQLDLATASFDVYLSVSVLEHVPDKGKTIEEAARVLKPGGFLIMTFDISEPEMGMSFPEWNGRALTMQEFDLLFKDSPWFKPGLPDLLWNTAGIEDYLTWHRTTNPLHNYVTGAAVVQRNEKVWKDSFRHCSLRALRRASKFIVISSWYYFYILGRFINLPCRLARSKNIHMLRVRLSFAKNYTILVIKKIYLKLCRRGIPLIAISRIEHLGDIIACEPVSRYVRQQYPGAYIVWCVEKPYRELVESNPHIDQTLSVHCLSEWIYLAQSGLFTEIIDLHFEGLACPVCRRPLSKAKGDKSISFNNYYQLGNLLSVFSKSAGLPALNEQPKIYIPEYVVRRMDNHRLPSEFVVVHCLSNERSRDWEPAKWLELISLIIQEFKINIMEVGLAPVIKNTSLPMYNNFCGKLSLLETAELIRRAKLFIGVDSGFAHIANAVNTYGIILLGHYFGFKHYMPYSGNYENGKNATLIYEEGPLTNMSVERVYEAVAHKLKYFLP